VPKIIDPYAGLKELPISGGRAVEWATAPFKWDRPPQRHHDHRVSVLLNDEELLGKTIGYDEAIGINRVIIFGFEDAFGCKHGFGAVFGTE